MTNKVLIAGASGVVGASAVEAYLAAGWDVVALSRRAPEVDSTRPFQHLPCDLRDAASSKPALAALAGVTHVVYAALFEQPGLIAGWQDAEQMRTNLAMLDHCLTPLLANPANRITHVSLLQGTKAYGIHLHPMPIPARERAPRDPHPNFYWLQEDWLREASRQHGFGWTILRPQLILGRAHGVAMNLIPVLGAYAAICRETGRPFGFPGGISYVWEAVDARLLANVFVWASNTEAAHGQYYNVTNGDVFEWRNLWPAIADELGVEPGPDAPLSMAEFLPAQAPVWDRIVARHGLRSISIDALLGESHHYADFCFAYGATTPPPPAFVSAIKLRRAGFTKVCDTEDTFVHWIADFQRRGVLPGR
ncbi:MAG: SDR family oxidoreductase [Nevskia sp.]|uniref:SDR family oxidoreductase n=1 Tax=Nevskia sp. TaxID=1929292 RepID=UPI004036BD59